MIDDHDYEVGQRFKVCIACFDIGQQLLQTKTSANIQAALSFIGISANNFVAALFGIPSDCFRLIVGRIFLMLG